MTVIAISRHPDRTAIVTGENVQTIEDVAGAVQRRLGWTPAEVTERMVTYHTNKGESKQKVAFAYSKRAVEQMALAQVV